jgi:hypothetical protein
VNYPVKILIDLHEITTKELSSYETNINENYMIVDYFPSEYAYLIYMKMFKKYNKDILLRKQETYILV